MCFLHARNRYVCVCESLVAYMREITMYVVYLREIYIYLCETLVGYMREIHLYIPVRSESEKKFRTLQLCCVPKRPTGKCEVGCRQRQMHSI